MGYRGKTTRINIYRSPAICICLKTHNICSEKTTKLKNLIFPSTYRYEKAKTYRFPSRQLVDYWHRFVSCEYGSTSVSCESVVINALIYRAESYE